MRDTYKKYRGLLIPKGAEDTSYQRATTYIDCHRGWSEVRCGGISCTDCILHRGNEKVADTYYTFKAARTFRGLFVPETVDEDYIPRPADNLLPGWHECRRHEIDTDRKLCSNIDIACSQCILGVCNSDIASKFFKNNNNKEKREMAIDTSKVHVDDLIHKFTSCYCETEDDRYYVVIRFSTNRAEAEVMLKALPMLPTFLWVEDPKDAAGCMVIVPFCLKHQAEEFQAELSRALGRLSKKSEVDEFLEVTNACADGRKFAADCSSLYDVWVKAISEKRLDYVEFMLFQVTNGSEVAAKFHKSDVPMGVLNWAYQKLRNWDLDDLDVYLKLNPFKQKAD